MDGGSFKHSSEGGERSSKNGSKDDSEGGENASKNEFRKGKRTAKTILDKPKEPKRGPGIAKLEQMRVDEEMKYALLRGGHSQQPPPNSYPGVHSLKATRVAPYPVPYSQVYVGALFPYQGLPNFAGTGIVAPYSLASYQQHYVHSSQPYPPLTNFATAYGIGGMSGQSLMPPTTRSHENPSNTLPLFQATPGQKADLKREEDPNKSVESTSKRSNDSYVDLDLKL
ncbi:hypothetical protein ACP4OV_021539 [Aristida adscensionis]